MPPLAKNIFGVVAGLIGGGVINGLLINVSAKVIPPPAGADVTTMEGLKASLHLFEPKHFVFPFVAHAAGTLVGAIVATRLAASPRVAAYVVAGFFLLGGVINAIMLPAPAWFIALDLIGAYLPMAWIATRLGRKETAPPV